MAIREILTVPHPVLKQVSTPVEVVDDELRALMDDMLATVVEVSGRDRPGLLEAIARTVATSGLSIQSAHIDCYGERAVDAFYVSSPEGAKVKDARQLGALRQSLTAVMQDAEPDGKPRLKLERARASVAR